MNIILNHRQERFLKLKKFRVNNVFLSRIVVRKETSLYFAVYHSRLVPVRRFPSPSRSIHVGDVSEANGQETPHIFA